VPSATFGVILKRARERAGWSQAQAARHLRVALVDYRSVEDGELPRSPEMYERTVELIGWPRVTVTPDGKARYR
jgi:ribosome-binding protein aMBF1 (putative translation factor)